jgi:hypothetical protein
MNPLSNLLSGGVSGVFDGVRNIIGAFVADPDKKLAAATELSKLQIDFQEKQIEAEKSFAEQQASVIISEAKSDSWLARNWRPITMLSFVFIIVWNFVVVPLFHQTPVGIPEGMWSLLDIGIGGYIGARTVEKVSDTIGTVAMTNKGK